MTPFCEERRKVQKTLTDCNNLPQNQNKAGRSMNLFGAVNNKLFNFKNDDYLLEKGSHIFVSDRVSEPIALRIIDIS